MGSFTKNKRHKRRLKFVLYVAILLIVVGLGNIIMGSTRAQVYTEIYRSLEAKNKPEPEKIEKFSDLEQKETDVTPEMNKTIQTVEAERLAMHLKRTKARLDFYRVVNMGGKSLLVVAALLLLYCLYSSKDLDSKLLSEGGNSP